MKTAPLAELTAAVTTWNPGRKPGAEFDYIDLSAVDSTSKAVTAATRMLGSEAPSRARQLVAAGDVLVSTVRPNLNSVAVVPRELDGATASTGFTVLRPTAELDGRFLFHWVRSPGFISDMVSKATGASYPAVSDRIVKNSRIPCLPLVEQQRIAAILDQADAIRTKRRQVVANLHHLARATFSAMFGDTRERSRLKDMGVDFLSGKNVLGQESDAHPVNRVIKVSAISSGRFVPTESKPMPRDYTPPAAHRLQTGDILFGRASGSLQLLGATAVVEAEPDALFLPDKVWRLQTRPGAQVLPLFILGVLRSAEARAFIRHNASGAAGVRNIGKAKLLEYVAPLPPLMLQREFAVRFEAIHAQRAAVERALVADDELFASLQSRAFRGEL